MSDPTPKQYFEVSAHLIAEQQTRNIERIFRSSRPSPRNRAMGFRGEDTPNKRTPRKN